MNLLISRGKPSPQPPFCIARYVCTKISWRGKYRRILCVTPSEIVTFDPSTFKATNVYSLRAGDADVDGVQLGPGGGGSEDEGEIIISARGDKKVRHAPCKS